MTIPEQEGRPVWEPVVIALFLAVLVAYDRGELMALLQGRTPFTSKARSTLELGVAVIAAWGLVASLYRALRWKPGSDDAA
ncbi:MAG TPA: hypothetical protein VGM25_07490 [Caulobacteraceae bacterium]|jgi:hypothetical protein